MRLGVPSAAVMLAALAACAHPRPAVFPVSSEGSDYSPVVQLWTRVAHRGTVLDVYVDSGTVIEPGQPAPGAPVLMSNLTFAAMAVVSLEPSPTRATQPWSVIGEADAQPLADSLRMGVQERVAATHFQIALPIDTDPKRTWIAYRIQGDAINMAVRLGDGTVIPASTRRNAIHVFACANRNLDGRVDEPRADALAKAYGTRC